MLNGKKNNYTNKVKVGDYIFNCHQCGMPCWYSKTTKLTKETGKGGLRVCQVCVDKVDFGLIPYTIRAERPIPEANPNAATPAATGVDYSTFDPLSGELPD